VRATELAAHDHSTANAWQLALGQPVSAMVTPCIHNKKRSRLQVTAIEISALKRVSKGAQVLLLDRNGGGTAKAVARELGKLGFRKVYILEGGFSGWTSSKLQVRQPVRSRELRGGFQRILPFRRI
jgi:Rhodanese-like domain